MTEVPEDRTCEKAGIPDAYCGCFQMVELNVTAIEEGQKLGKQPTPQEKMVKDGAGALIARINGALEKYFDICFRWILKKIMKVSKKMKENKYMIMILVETSEVNNNNKNSNNNSNNNSAIFKGWVTEKNHEFTIKLDDISRLDKYGLTSQCILKKAYNLKEFCRCK